MKTYLKNEEAVSPVIGVILMVAINVVLAAVVYVLVADMGKVHEQAPEVQLQEEGDSGNWTVILADKGLNWSDFQVTGCTTVPMGSLDAGDRLIECGEGANMVHKDTNTLVWRN